MNKLDLPLSKCEECPLYQSPHYKPHASYQGNLDSPDILFIGEAPQGYSRITKKEDIGLIGRLLKRELKKVDLDDFAYMNLIACQNVGENKWGKEVNNKPSSTHIKCCKPNFEAIIEQINPKIIVALGATPTKKLGIKGKFVGVRGVVHETKYGNVLPVLHPNQVLMKPNFLDDFRTDLGILNSWIKGDYEEESPEGKYVCIDDMDQVYKLRDTLKAVDRYAFDIEATGLFHFRDVILGVGFAPKIGLSIYLPLVVKNEDGDLEEYWENQEEVLDILREILGDPETKKIAHNGKYDIKMLEYFLGSKVENFWMDTMLAHYLLDENRGHSLKPVGSTYFPQFKNYDAELHKHISMSKQDDANFSDVPLDILALYCNIDCDLTLRLHYKFLEEMDEKQKKYLFKFYMPLSRAYKDAELLGIKVDRPYLLGLLEEYQSKADDLQNKLFTQAEKEFNPNSPQQMAEILFTDLGFKSVVKTASGNPSTAEGVLKELPHDHENYSFIENLLEYRGVQKMLSTYIKPILEKIDENDRLHPSFLLHGTVTGRLSSKNPNIQNIPRDPKIRGIFIPSPGYKFVSIDYSQVELRVMAFYSGDPVMTEAYVTGKDLHTGMASEIYKLPEDQIDGWKRKRAKLVNFGYVYGAQAQRAMESINEKAGDESEKITLLEAKTLRRIFFERHIGVKKYINKIHKLIHRQGYVESCFGRVRRLPQVRSPLKTKVKEAEREGLNAIVQGTASDLTQLAVIKIHKMLQEYKTNFLFTVHDEINFEVHEDELSLIEKMKAMMEETPDGFDFPIVADVEIYKERWKT